MSKFGEINVAINGDTRAIAYLQDEGAADKPAFIWLGGFRSDMRGSKAEALSHWCQTQNLSFLRFDYSGHGESGGEFKQGCISIWLEESLSALELAKQDEIVLVGSSMGGWLALRIAQEIKARNLRFNIRGMILIAPAPDFATDLMPLRFTDEQKADLARQGYFEEMTPYGPDPLIITQKLLDDGALNKVLDKPLSTGCEVMIMQGILDEPVPWQHAMRLMEHLTEDNVSMTIIKDGDHSLSRPQDIEVLKRLCGEMTKD